jgi:sulfite reductase beta subunit-like hemoprotein
MYQYTDFDRAFVRARAAQFRDQLDRHLRSELPDDDFRALRLQNGWYVQRARADAARGRALRGCCPRTSCARWRASRVTSTAAGATSPRARTCSSTGSRWPARPT